MTIQQDNNGNYILKPRKAGIEASAGVAFAPDINGDGGMMGYEGGLEGISGGLLTYCVYSAVLSFLDSESSVKQGLITRADQRSIVLKETWAATKGSVPTVVILTCLLCVFPFLGLPATIAGVVGAGWMATRITKAAFNAMSIEQRETLTRKAEEVGVAVKGLTDTDETSAQPA